ncbi:MAG TPA: hypothetical protein VLD59_08270 [Steroidobacteraceae bacterium]|nr:hypothetical protein [Steroidobacteraceae bacterium]
MTIRTQIWNNGGGTQSAAIAALIVTGKLPKPDLAAIADTGREKSATWDYHERYIAPALASVGVTMHRVLKEDWAAKDLYGGADGETLLIQAFTTQGGNSEVGKLPGFCSGEWKRDVVRRWASARGVTAATNWIGYSTDEMGRAYKLQHSAKAQGKWHVDFPLIRLGMDRGACAHYALQILGALPGRSSCWMCPNMHMGEWRDVMADERDRHKVIQFDLELRKRDPHAWLTDQAVPIDRANFDDSNEVLFGRDGGACDSGMCFV